MNKLKGINIPKYIKRLKQSQLPAYVVGQGSSMGLTEVYHPAYDRAVQVPMRIQLKEFYGKMNEDHEYFSNEYKHLLLNLKEIDHNYSHSQSNDTRAQLAKSQIDLWKNFIAQEREKLPEREMTINEGTILKLKDVWERTKVRSSLNL